MEDVFYRWLVEAVAGLILIGFGLSLFGQAVIYKSKGESVRKWFLWGTVSLVVVNAGICVFGDAVKQRVIYESQNRLRERAGQSFAERQKFVVENPPVSRRRF